MPADAGAGEAAAQTPPAGAAPPRRVRGVWTPVSATARAAREPE